MVTLKSTNIARIVVSVLQALSIADLTLKWNKVKAFVPSIQQQCCGSDSLKQRINPILLSSAFYQQSLHVQHTKTDVKTLFSSKNDNDDDSILPMHPSGNPYADPNYPDLEFVNYDDPEYQVNQGGDDESQLTDEDAIEEMREERRRRNDEYQFQTYYTDILKNGKEFFGEWTVYRTSTFLPNNNNIDTTHPPQLIKLGGGSSTSSDSNNSNQPTVRVVSSAYKETVATSSPHPTDAERIRHVETILPTLVLNQENNDKYDDATLLPDTDFGLGVTKQQEVDKGSKNEPFAEQTIKNNVYWPDPLKATDFRGHQGIMVCGSAWTICTAVPLHSNSETLDPYKGPFSEYRAELGIQENNLRLRLKFDYSVLENDKQNVVTPTTTTTPALHLKSLTVCREALGMWPSSTTTGNYKGDKSITATMENVRMKEAFFGGSPGADGGLYDPPPIKSEEQAGQYMMLDLEGKATALFPYVVDQTSNAHNGEGWVHSLDWTPGIMRYQVDRKVNSGPDLLGLRTLELSEVQGADAETYRPRDGGQNMRQ